MTNSTAQNSITLSTPKNGGSMPFNPLSHLAPTNSTPADFSKFPYNHDFIDAKGNPRLFTRIKGHPVPVVGSEVITAYGVGFIERINAGECIVRIVEFDESVEVPQYGKTGLNAPTHYISARTQVSKLSELYNNRLLTEANWYLSKFGATKKNTERTDAMLDLALDDDCYECRFVGGDYGGATEFYHVPAINPNLRAKKKTRAQIKAERKALEAEANRYLEDLEAPEGIADELAEFYGEE